MCVCVYGPVESTPCRFIKLWARANRSLVEFGMNHVMTETLEMDWYWSRVKGYKSDHFERNGFQLEQLTTKKIELWSLLRSKAVI